MTVITSCNIACGGHYGDPQTMRKALQLAKENQVVAGAHPSFPDRENFGRTRSTLAGVALEAVLREQVLALKDIADDMALPLTHIKPHGALYNMAARDAELSSSILNVLQGTMPTSKIVGPPKSELERCALERGVGFIAEGFADRAYEADGQLRDRKEPGAVIHNSSAQVEQAANMALHHKTMTYAGNTIPLQVETICVHGDTPSAFKAAQAIRSALQRAGVTICAPG